jgi:CAAX protease family protein
MSLSTHLATGRARTLLWSAWVVFALLILEVAQGVAYALLVAATAAVVAAVPGALPMTTLTRNRTELLVMGGLYLGVVALMALAFRVFTQDNVAGLFLSFAGALLLGVVGPIYYTVWRRGGTVADLGLRLDNWRETAVLALLFGAVQFALTLWGYDLPAAQDWVPLLTMALVVGVFESIFFRGFLQSRLEAQFGSVAGVAGAAVLYGIYHVGYGMDGSEILFLTGLGVVYAIAFAIPRNVLVLWPLLTPLGSFFNTVDAGDIEMPWMSMLGFADVLALMAGAIWWARRHQRSRRSESTITMATTPVGR